MDAARAASSLTQEGSPDALGSLMKAMGALLGNYRKKERGLGEGVEREGKREEGKTGAGLCGSVGCVSSVH